MQSKTNEYVESLLASMTLEEKVAQLYCFGRSDRSRGILHDDGTLNPDGLRKAAPHGMSQFGRPGRNLSPRAGAELNNAIQRYLIEETRLGIPAMFNQEGLHGLMADDSTSFPVPLALASSWNTALIEAVFSIVAREARVRGINYIYTPVLDLAREPRWGRCEETFGEDPWLVTRMGVAALHGLQGDETPIADDKVICCAKHYAVHGQPEGGQNSAPNNFSERIIREEFLPMFKAAVQEANVAGIMAAYNEVDGVPGHVNAWLLQTVLRDEWGFTGFVTSDGMGVQQLHTLHHVSSDSAETARQALAAGIDNEVPLATCYPTLVEQVEAGLVPIEQVDRSVRRILQAKARIGLFEGDPYVDPDEAERVTGCDTHRAVALQAAQESVILLKNEENLLPLSAETLTRIAVIGPNAADVHLGGYADEPKHGVSVLDGIRQKVGDNIEVVYAEGCRIAEGVQGHAAWRLHDVELTDPADNLPRIAEAVEVAKSADVVILAIGGNESTCREGWWFDHLGDRDELTLVGQQDDLVDAVVATGTPTVAVVINGRPLAITNVAETVPAILECWYPGQEGGTAIADILFGDVNPSGKLPVTIPRSVGQLPVYYYHKVSARRGYLIGNDTPLFPFGFGLSYTTFEYDNVRLERETIGPDECVTVSAEITNTGSRPGAEIAQLYIHDQIATVTRPIKLLKGFQKITLAPGETETVSFEIKPNMLALLNRQMESVVEPGLFDVMVGGSSAETTTVVLQVT